MLLVRSATVLGLLAVSSAGARAGDEVLVPGDPPLTRSVADRKIDFWEWVFARQLDERRREELRRLEADEWKQRDKEWKARWVHFLDAWHDALATAGNRLHASRSMALDSLGRASADRVGTWMLTAHSGPPPAMPGTRPPAGGNHAVSAHLQVLKLRQDQHDQFMRMLSDARARQHETMMTIIRNIGPSGRYEYNPASGKYDRYVPNP
jgi:hypothetical protein